MTDPENYRTPPEVLVPPPTMRRILANVRRIADAWAAAGAEEEKSGNAATAAMYRSAASQIYQALEGRP